MGGSHDSTEHQLDTKSANTSQLWGISDKMWSRWLCLVFKAAAICRLEMRKFFVFMLSANFDQMVGFSVCSWPKLTSLSQRWVRHYPDIMETPGNQHFWPKKPSRFNRFYCNLADWRLTSSTWRITPSQFEANCLRKNDGDLFLRF